MLGLSSFHLLHVVYQLLGADSSTEQLGGFDSTTWHSVQFHSLKNENNTCTTSVFILTYEAGIINSTGAAYREK